jgi:hypothetical protein
MASGEWRPFALFIGLFILTASIVLASGPAIFFKRSGQEQMAASPLMPGAGEANRL